MTHPVSLRAIVAAAALFGGMTVAQAQETIFYSTQLRPIEEATKVRDVLLKGIPGKVTYVVDEPPAFAVRMKAETQAGKRTASVVGALHGELQPHVPADLQPVDDVAAKLTDRGIPASLMELGKLGTGQQQYIPWMQATYVMVANKQALQYLPAGADVNSPHLCAAAAMGARTSSTRPASAGSASRPARRACCRASSRAISIPPSPAAS